MKLRQLLFLGMVLVPLAFTWPAMAEENVGKDGHSAAQGSQDPGKGHSKEKKMQHQGGGHKMHLFTEDWHNTLTDAQKIEVDTMHLHLMKETAPIKAEIKRKKIELAVLATEDRADAKAIKEKIDEILSLKGQKMQKRFAHIVEMRGILSAEQRLSYDMLIVGRAAQGKK